MKEFNLNLTNPTWDLLLISFFIIAAFFYGLSIGRSRLILMLLSTYLTLAIFTVLPLNALIGGLKNGEIFAVKISIFLGIIFLLFFLLSRSFLQEILERGRTSIWHILIFSLLQTGFLISQIIAFIPNKNEVKLAPLTNYLFASSEAYKFWILLPMLALILIKPKEDDE